MNIEILTKSLSRENNACYMRALCCFCHEFTIVNNVTYYINSDLDHLDINAIY